MSLGLNISGLFPLVVGSACALAQTLWLKTVPFRICLYLETDNDNSTPLPGVKKSLNFVNSPLVQIGGKRPNSTK